MGNVRFNLSKHYADPREKPIYGIPQAAHLLRLPAATLRSWVLGRTYPTEKGRRKFRPVIQLPDPNRPLLSFFNLAEAHMLRAFRSTYGVQLDAIRKAIGYVKEYSNSPRPLIEQSFETDGEHLFIRRKGKLVDASALGQEVFPAVMSHVERLEYERNLVVRFYPFTRPDEAGPKSVFIDPNYSFGRPVLAECGVPTDVIAERYQAGESIDAIARDYACERLQIEEAIRCELCIQSAA